MITPSSSLGVSLADYGGGAFDNNPEGFVGNGDAQSLSDLSKALDAGSLTGRQTTGLTNVGGASLKTESLEATLKVITFQESDIRFWKRISKLPAYNTVEEFNQLLSYGADRGGFNQEGALPNEEDSVYTRQAELVKFMGVVKSVTHPMTLVNTNVGSIIEREVKNGTLWILRKANRALVYGDSRFVPEEWNGLYAQHEAKTGYNTLKNYLASDVVIDLRGRTLAEADIETGAQTIIDRFGEPDLFMCPPRVLSDFAKSFYGNKYIVPNTPSVTGAVMGQNIKSFASNFGDIEMAYDKFMNSGYAARYSTSPATNPTKGPAAPIVASSGTAVSVVDATTKFNDSTGDYVYGVTAINSNGESAMTLFPTGSSSSWTIAVASGRAIDLTFVDGGGTTPATGYNIYRSKKNAINTATASTVPMYQIFSVSVDQLAAGFDGGAAGVVRDRNNYLPGTLQSWMGSTNEEIMAFKQLAPLMKMDLAQLGPAYRFMILLYGTPQLYAPTKIVRYINIGTGA